MKSQHGVQSEMSYVIDLNTHSTSNSKVILAFRVICQIIYISKPILYLESHRGIQSEISITHFKNPYWFSQIVPMNEFKTHSNFGQADFDDLRDVLGLNV